MLYWNMIQGSIQFNFASSHIALNTIQFDKTLMFENMNESDN